MLFQLSVLKEGRKPCKQNAQFFIIRVNISVRHECVEVFSLVTSLFHLFYTMTAEKFAVKNDKMFWIEISFKFKKEKLLTCVQMEF